MYIGYTIFVDFMEDECECGNHGGCGCGGSGHGGCGCAGSGGSGMRNFLTKAEKIEMLEEYKKGLENEAKGVEERIRKLKSEK